MSVKCDIKPWKDIQRLLNGKGVPLGEINALLSATGQQSLTGKSCIAAHMLSKMKANNVK